MSELEPVWCVRHGKDHAEPFWCATRNGEDCGSDSIVGALCGDNVYAHPTLESHHRLPTCPGCLWALQRRALRQAGTQEDKKQGVLF